MPLSIPSATRHLKIRRRSRLGSRSSHTVSEGKLRARCWKSADAAPPFPLARHQQTLHSRNMSVAQCIQGLETMTLGAGGGASQMAGTVTTLDDGYCITERYAAAGAILKVGGLDGYGASS